MGNASGRRVKRKDAGEKILPKLTVHPLFFVLGLWYFFRGEITLFIISAIVALQHEYAHAFAAAKVGVRLNKVVLTPYGAVLDGEIDCVPLKDEIFVAMAGPLCNFLTAFAFVALWWLFPETYAFTDEACFASLSVAMINLLPAYPLDGGRVLYCLLLRGCLKRGVSPKESEKKSKIACRVIALFIAAVLLFFFIFLAVKNTVNYTLLVFALFVAVGAFGNGKKASFERIRFLPKHNLLQGAEIRRVAASKDMKIKRAVCFFERGRYLIFDVFDGDTSLGSLSETQLLSAMESLSYYATLKDALRKVQENKI